MSVRAISWAYGQSLGSASQKAVLLHLAYLAREEDNCARPHVTRIQAETELSERTVRKALKALQDKGLIALGDQNLAAGHGNGDIVPANRRPKVWILRLTIAERLTDHDGSNHGMGPGTRARGTQCDQSGLVISRIQSSLRRRDGRMAGDRHHRWSMRVEREDRATQHRPASRPRTDRTWTTELQRHQPEKPANRSGETTRPSYGT